MKNKIFNRRIPTLLGIGFILLGLVVITAVIGNRTGFRGFALNSEEPKDIQITNISDSSFTVTYVTDFEVNGSVNYGDSQDLGSIATDDRDKGKGEQNSRKTHSITIEELSSEKKYYFEIISGSSNFLNNDIPFEVSTAPKSLEQPTLQKSLKGQVLNPDGKPATATIVYLTANSSQTLSALVNNNGTFSFDLKSLRSKNLLSFINLNDSAILDLSVTNGKEQSNAKVKFSKSDSIPTITLGNNYDFTFSSQSNTQNNASPESFPSTYDAQDTDFQLLIPEENQSFTDQRPQFRGKSLPNEEVEITINSEHEIKANVLTDSLGNWIFRPEKELEPGEHTITVTSRNSSGILTTLKKTFLVLSSGTQVAEAATPSATPTLQPTSTPAPIASPTATATLGPTSALTPTPTLIPVVQPDLPPTGGSDYLLALAAIAITTFGFALFFSSRKSSI
jgi:hypothetical protein